MQTFVSVGPERFWSSLDTIFIVFSITGSHEILQGILGVIHSLPSSNCVRALLFHFPVYPVVLGVLGIINGQVVDFLSFQVNGVIAVFCNESILSVCLSLCLCLSISGVCVALGVEFRASFLVG